MDEADEQADEQNCGGTPQRGKRGLRQERLAAALRQNLRRRKTQARARQAGAGGASAPHAPDPRADPAGDPDPDPDPA